MATKLTVNGFDYQVEKDDVVVIIGQYIHKNGQMVDTRSLKTDIQVIVDGPALAIDSSTSVTVNGNVSGNIDAGDKVLIRGQEIEIGAIESNANVTIEGGNVQVNGNIDAGEDVNVSGNVVGDIDAGENVRIGGKVQKNW